jgi:hypothetical protein
MRVWQVLLTWMWLKKISCSAIIFLEFVTTRWYHFA